MWQIRGQDKIVALLERSIEAGSIAHAYLLVGPRHVGKGALALNVAQALNCGGPGRPCGECQSCRRIREGKHADVTWLGLDSKTEIGIDDIRELQRLANLPPYEGGYKVFVIDGAEHLSTEAANSLLKVLEEPPHRVVWLLLGTEERRLLPTIVSRCQRLDLRPLPLDEMRKLLTETYGLPPEKADLLTRLSQGRLGWALSALSNDDVLKTRSERTAELAALPAADLDGRFAYAQNLSVRSGQKRLSLTETVEAWLGWWRDLLLVKGGCTHAVTNIDYQETLEKQARALSLAEIRGFLSDLYAFQEDMYRNINIRLALESLMLKLPRKADSSPGRAASPAGSTHERPERGRAEGGVYE